MRTGCRALLACVCLGFAPPAFAQVPAGGTIPVDPLGWPATAVGIHSATGRFLIVAPSSTTLIGHGFEADGSPAGPAFGFGSFGSDPTVVGGGDGTFFVTWVSYPRDAADVYSDIYGAGVDASGSVRVPPFRLVTSTNAGRDFPRPVQLSTGDYVAIWTSGTAAIVGRRFDRRLRPAGNEFTLAPSVSGGVHDARVAAGPNGTFLVTWTREPQWDNVARVFGSDAQPLGPLVVVQSGTGAGRFPTGAAIGDRGFVVVCGLNSNRATFLDPAGHRVGADVELTPVQPFIARRFVAADETGAFVVTWFTWGGRSRTIHVRRFDPGGLPRGPEVTVVERPEYQLYDYYGTGGDTFGNFVVAWWLDDPNLHGTFAQRYGGLYPAAVRVDTTATPLSDGNGVLEPGEGVDPHLVAQPQRRHADLRRRALQREGTRDSPFYPSVETVLHAGVSAGCGGRAFCPQNPTTREQMAAMLLTGKEGAGYRAPACATPLFGDVPASSPFCPFVEELARRGITNGCGGGNYCPGDAVSREQMAVFVLRTLDPALDPRACGTPVFADVPASSAFCRWIEELARRGIASGCGGGNFCPGAPVTREQMAVFLTTTFGLQLYGP